MFTNPTTATEGRLFRTNVLVIDDDEMLVYLRHCLEKEFPQAQITTLAKDVEDRYQDAGRLIRALDDLVYPSG